MYYVYVLKSKNFKKSYVGFTDNIKRRLKEHNIGKNFYTKRFRPWAIVSLEKFSNKFEAIKKEKFYKTRMGRRKLEKIFSRISNSEIV